MMVPTPDGRNMPQDPLPARALARQRSVGTTTADERLHTHEQLLAPAAPGRSMRIFVTGALGFVGAHFVERALAAEHQITGVYRTATANKGDLLDSLTRQGAKLVQGDILEPRTYEEALQDADCVCHFAAAFKGSKYSDGDFRRINVTGTAEVLRAAAGAHVRRFVLCSTAGVYGRQIAGVADESAEARPWN